MQPRPYPSLENHQTNAVPYKMRFFFFFFYYVLRLSVGLLAIVSTKPLKVKHVSPGIRPGQAGLRNGDTVTAIAQLAELAATKKAFAPPI